MVYQMHELSLTESVNNAILNLCEEARVPFTDHRLAEYLFSLPDD